MLPIKKHLLTLCAVLFCQLCHAGGAAPAPDTLRSANRAAELVSAQQKAAYEKVLDAYDQAQRHQPGDAALAIARCTFIQRLAWYEVRIDGASVVKSIDDATAAGIAGTYGGQPIRLACTPILSKPDDITDAQIESMRFANPKGTREELKELYIAIPTVETGRHCTITDAAAELFTVDVRSQ